MGRRVMRQEPDTPSLLKEGLVLTVAQQVRLGLQEQEDQRYREEKASGQKARRRNVSLPVVRMGPEALCHRDQGFLELVCAFDYDLADPAFCEYAKRRGVLSLAGVPHSG